jgi:hypothetical protein
MNAARRWSDLKRIGEELGRGWELRRSLPPPGLFVLNERDMIDPSEVEPLCRHDGNAVLVYIAARIGDKHFIYGRVKPSPRIACPVVTFIKSFRDPGEALVVLLEYARRIEEIPDIRLNIDILREYGLCEESRYALLCAESIERALRRRLEERLNAAPAHASRDALAAVQEPAGERWGTAARWLEELVRAADEADAEGLRRCLAACVRSCLLQRA